MSSHAKLVGIALAALLVGGGIVAGAVIASNGASASANSGGERTITVSATGDVETSADEALVRVAVVSTSQNVSVARETVAENASSMRDALAELGVADDQIRTDSYDIYRDRYGYEGDREEAPYRAVQSFTITLSNTSLAGPVVDAAVNGGASEVRGVQFTLAEETRDDLREQALREAMNRSRAEADVIANSSGLVVTGVRTASTTNVDRTAVTYDTAAAEAGGTQISSGPVTVSASIEVTYNATAV
jgi:uncharacterized protein YggE